MVLSFAIVTSVAAAQLAASSVAARWSVVDGDAGAVVAAAQPEQVQAGVR